MTEAAAFVCAWCDVYARVERSQRDDDGNVFLDAQFLPAL